MIVLMVCMPSPIGSIHVALRARCPADLKWNRADMCPEPADTPLDELSHLYVGPSWIALCSISARVLYP